MTLVEICKVVWYIVAILFGGVIALALIMEIVKAIIRPFKVRKAKAELKKLSDEIGKTLQDLIKECEEKKETKPKKPRAKKESKK